MNEKCIRIYKTLVPAALLALGSGCISASSETSEYVELNLDDYGRMDRRDFIEIIRQHYGNMVFIKGRIMATKISYPEAQLPVPYVGYGDGRVYPCTNNPFDVPLEEYPTHERVRAGLVPNPWLFHSKFVAELDDSVASTKMEISYESLSPVKEVAISEIHGKCVTMLVKLTGEMEISSISSAGKLYIHNIYDTESSLGGE